MTITTLIGLTDEEINRAHDELYYELLQLDEITRHYEARILRRSQRIQRIRKLAAVSKDFGKRQRFWAKDNELDNHDDRDRIRWLAGMDRRSKLLKRWNAMFSELEASKEATA